MLTLPLQCDKCLTCCIPHDTNFEAEQSLIFKPWQKLHPNKKLQDTFRLLMSGKYPHEHHINFCRYLVSKVMVVFFLLLFLPLITFGLVCALILYLLIFTFVCCRHQLVYKRCCGFCECCRNIQEKYNSPGLVFHYHSLITTEEAAAIVSDRFMIYRVMSYLLSLSIGTYIDYCEFLAGQSCVPLMSKELLMVYSHLFSVTKAKFQYKYTADDESAGDIENAVGIKGFGEDFAFLQNYATLRNWGFDVLSVYIDYENNNRFTIEMKDGDKFREPVGDNVSEEEYRVWHVIVAHYQCLLSIVGVITHSWTHFHWNECNINYMEEMSRGREMIAQSDKNILIRILECHSLYTTSLNDAGLSSGLANPSFKEYSRCGYFCQPWKETPFQVQIFRDLILDLTEEWYFVDAERGNFDDAFDNNNAQQLNIKQKQKRVVINAVESDSEVDGDEEKQLFMSSNAKKVANMNAFPPLFVRRRLNMKALDAGVIITPSNDFMSGSAEPLTSEETSAGNMHRGYSLYQDMLSDYYAVIYRYFIRAFYAEGLISDEDLNEWISHIENSGLYNGIKYCGRPFLHILTTFVWSNLVHACDHTLLGCIMEDYACSTMVRYRGRKWIEEHPEYTWEDILHGTGSGTSWMERWRVQFGRFRIETFYKMFVKLLFDPSLVADHMMDDKLYCKFKDIDSLDEDGRRLANEIHMNYLNEMKKVDAKYHWLIPATKFTASVSY